MKGFLAITTLIKFNVFDNSNFPPNLSWSYFFIGSLKKYSRGHVFQNINNWNLWNLNLLRFTENIEESIASEWLRRLVATSHPIACYCHEGILSFNHRNNLLISADVHKFITMARSQKGNKEKLSRKEKLEQRKENVKLQDQLKTVRNWISICCSRNYRSSFVVDCVSNPRRRVPSHSGLRVHEDSTVPRSNGISWRVIPACSFQMYSIPQNN